MLLGVGGERGTLLVGHVAVGQAIGPSHDVDGGSQVDYAEYLAADQSRPNVGSSCESRLVALPQRPA